jgi:hypothetical protein
VDSDQRSASCFLLINICDIIFRREGDCALTRSHHRKPNSHGLHLLGGLKINDLQFRLFAKGEAFPSELAEPLKANNAKGQKNAENQLGT